ncbi:MAG TPA: hypothetical protein VN622_00625 [Clostridia bacterium]|nr:hypothetical protein [Clostridia bacterium]
MRTKPLWAADRQQERLLEFTADSGDAWKDIPLQRDVCLLGALLGDVLVEQGSTAEVFKTMRIVAQTEFPLHEHSRTYSEDRSTPLGQ